ncbi:hypothetical protein KY366_02740 [Candidatus Woesearchaeota archaeon]|nr:hypothetical protein [Candidatus Woesearchaeota archaeon]
MDISKNKRIVCLMLVLVFCAGIVINTIVHAGEEKNIEIVLEYKSGTVYDPDDNGIETIGNIIDFTVEDSAFDWELNYSRLCTRWNVNSDIYLCYGGEECCGFIGLDAEGSWDDVFYLNYGRYNASYSNNVSAQVIYVDYDLEVPYEDVVYSGVSSLNATFEKRRAEVVTKIEDLAVFPSNVSKGEVVNANATLLEQNNSCLADQQVGIYVDGDLVDTEMTGSFGEVTFEIGTSYLAGGEHTVQARFLGSEASSEEEITEYLASYSDTETLFVLGGGSQSDISFEEIEDCRMEYWETEEPVYGTCQREHVTTICDDPPINQSCNQETEYYNYTCKTGTQIVQHSKEICTPKELRIIRADEQGKIDFEGWGKCSAQEEADSLIVVCDSKFDGNNDGICQPGESCVRFIITEDNVERSLKNSQEGFTAEDDSFFLEELDYEVMAE